MRSTLLVRISSISIAALYPLLTFGGSYLESTGGNPNRVNHPPGYTGVGISLLIDVCVPNNHEMSAQTLYALEQAAQTWASRTVTTGNLDPSLSSAVPEGYGDYESLFVHELGHCIGLGHPNIEKDPEGNHVNFTKSSPGADGALTLDSGVDGLEGSPDDQRGDDINLHWFFKSHNNPFYYVDLIDNLNYSRDINHLNCTNCFVANGDRLVAAEVFNLPNTEAIMQQQAFLQEVQRSLTADDVATARFAMSGLDEIANTPDDYEFAFSVQYGTGCDINVRFINSIELGGIAGACGPVSYSSLGGSHYSVDSATLLVNLDHNWYTEGFGQCSFDSGRVASRFFAGVCLPQSMPPAIQTNPPTDIAASSATFNLAVNPNGSDTIAAFQWGQAEASLPHSVPEPPYYVGKGDSTITRSHSLTNLDCDTRYYYQAWADGYGPLVTGEVLSFWTDDCGGGGGSDPIDLIDNGDFGNNDDHWVTTGYFQADDRFNGYLSYPGYAYLAKLDGSWGNSIVGELYQEITIPSGTESATLQYWYWISTNEPIGSPPRDVLTATIRDSHGNFLKGLDSYSNNDAYAGGYRSDEFDLSEFIGESIQVHFIGTTSSLYPTVFRLDDLSLIVTDDDGDGSDGFDLRAFNPEVDDSTPTPGDKVRFSFSTTNVGDERAPGDVPVTYFLDGTAVAFDSEETALDPGEVDGEAESFSVPEAPGTYHAWACLATYSEEPSTSNNCTDTVALTVAEDPTEGPDIVIINTTTTKTTLLAGETFDMTATVKNVGNESLSANSLVRFLVTLDGSLDLDDEMLEADTVSWLSVGQERVAQETMQAPLEPGTYLLGACVKVLGDEINENNNCSPDPFILEVLPNGCQPENIALSDITVLSSETYEACESITLGPSVSVEAGGSLRLNASRVVFREGFRVNAGGRLRVVAQN